jgi:hypothetical protein
LQGLRCEKMKTETLPLPADAAEAFGPSARLA